MPKLRHAPNVQRGRRNGGPRAPQRPHPPVGVVAALRASKARSVRRARATAVGRVFVEAIFAEQRAQLGMKTTEHGAVTHIQRFGGSLNLNCHYHVLVLDGAYVRDPDGLLLFRPCPPPSHDAIERVARRLHSLALRWLKRHHYLDERKAEERSNESEELSALDGCAQLALRSGLFVALKGEGDGGAKTPDEDD